MTQEEPPLRAGDAYIGKPPLLFELLFVVQRATVRKDTLLQAGDEDDWEFEPLGGVEGDQRNRVRAGFVRVLVGDQGRLLEKAVKGVVGREIVVAGGD